MARDHESTITKQDKSRIVLPTGMRPKEPQSTWPCSPGSVERRKNASWREPGRTSWTKRRSGQTDPS